MKKSKKTAADSRFPKYLPQRKTENAGVNALSTIVNNDFGWLFRKNNLENDFGIDAYIDIVKDDGSVTGQSIAVQIKTGKTYFKSKNDVGFNYKGERKHFNLYMNTPMPVILVICDVEKGRYRWVKFDPAETESSGGDWTIAIPHNNVFGLSDKDKIGNLVGDAVDHLEEISQYWAENKLLSDASMLLFSVDRSDVENKDLTNLKSFVSRINASKRIARKFQGRVEISFDGYNFDKRELFEIPEVVEYLRVADDVFRDWFFFLSTHEIGHALRLYFTCYVGVRRVVGFRENKKIIRLELDKEKMPEFWSNNFVRLNEKLDYLDMSLEDNKRITAEISHALISRFEPME